MKILKSLRSSRAAATIFSASMLAAGFALLPGPASAEIFATKCGAPVRSIVKTEEFGSFTTSSASPVNLPGASAKITVPTGSTRCVRVHFSGMVSCSETATNDRCDIRVVEVGAFPLLPQIVRLASEHTDFAAHGFEFVGVFGEGTHTIQVKASVFGPPTVFAIPTWTLDVEEDK